MIPRQTLTLQGSNSSSPREDCLINLLLSWCHGLLLPFFITRACIQNGVLALPAVSLLVVIDDSFSGGCGGVVIISNCDLLVILGLQLALVEAERPFKDVFDLKGSVAAAEKKTKNMHM